MFIGTINKSIVHPKEIFKYVYFLSAFSIIYVNNHPNCDPNPLKEDIMIIKALIKIGNIQDIKIIDNDYYSFS